MGKILIVEDDSTLQEVLKYGLGKEGHSIIQAYDGESALNLARQENPDLILLDVMLPVMSGLDVCRILRAESKAPIIMLTAKAEEIDKVVGLELGADDYVTKPFSMRELIARIKANLRRQQLSNKTQAANDDGAEGLKVANLRVDPAKHIVYRGNDVVELGPKEFELLAFLMAHRGKVLSREQILHKVWGYEYIGNDRTVDVHMRWLRLKLEDDPENPRHLRTVRGYGYKFEE